MVPSDWGLAPKCVCGPNFISYLLGESPTLSAARTWDITSLGLYTRPCVAVWCSALQRVAVCCSVLHCITVCCSVLQCVAVRCSVLSVSQHDTMCCSALQYVAVHCSMLQCVAVCCSALQ